MQRAMIRWSVKREAVDEELELLAAVYDELAALNPSGLIYNTYRLDDGLSFVAFAEMKDGLGVLGPLAAFQRYRRTLDERCTSGPTVVVLDGIGGRFYGEYHEIDSSPQSHDVAQARQFWELAERLTRVV